MTIKTIQDISVGQFVVIKHDQGLEIGTVESINHKSKRVLIFFNYESCPHYCSFNFSQINQIY
jgi:cytochrome oxidase Cu insertion factor (SCO1/SenC/PrrC family)